MTLPFLEMHGQAMLAPSTEDDLAFGTNSAGNRNSMAPSRNMAATIRNTVIAGRHF